MEFIKKELKKMELEIDEGMDRLFNKIKGELKEIELEIDEGANHLSNKIERGSQKMETEIDEGADPLLCARVDDIVELQPGDHIFVNRLYGSYSHHGIYIGGDLVIHFTKPKSKQESMSPKPPCEKCGYQKNRNRRVVKSCLDCFRKEDCSLTDHSLYLYLYGVSEDWFIIGKRGTCSKLPSKSLEEVVEKANGLFKSDGFGKYDLLENNCESFATFCKTGSKQSSQVDRVEFYGAVSVFALAVGAVEV